VGEFEQPELVGNFNILQASKIPRNKGKADQKVAKPVTAPREFPYIL
jgi:hypothetical protein